MAQGGGDPRAENAGADGGRYDRHLRGALRGGLGDGGLRLRPCGSAQPAYERGWAARSQGRISMVLTPPRLSAAGDFLCWKTVLCTLDRQIPAVLSKAEI